MEKTGIRAIDSIIRKERERERREKDRPSPKTFEEYLREKDREREGASAGYTVEGYHYSVDTC